MSLATARSTLKSGRGPVPSDNCARSAAVRRIICLAVAVLAIATRAPAQDQFSTSTGSEAGTGGTTQSCDQAYSEAQHQIVEAGTLVDANFKKQEIDCNGDPGCRRAAGEEYDAQGRELAKQRVDASAQHDICREQSEGGNGGAPSAPAGSALNPLRGYVSNQPEGPNGGNQSPPSLLQALNDAAGKLSPGGSQGLQKAGQAASQVDKTINGGLNDAARKMQQVDTTINGGLNDANRKMQAVANTMRQDLIKKWTHPMDPGTALMEVVDAWASNAFGAGVGGAARTGAEGGSFWKALKASASAAAEEGKVTAGLGRAAGAGTRIIASNSATGQNGPPTRLPGKVTAGGEPNGEGITPTNGKGNPGQRIASKGGQPSSEPAAPEESGPSAGTKAQFPPAPDPISRGMPPPVDNALKALAKAKKWVIVVRDSNPAAAQWAGRPGYLPKPQALKAKSIPYDPAKPMSEQPNAGLVRADKLTEQEQKLGYKLDPGTGLVSQYGKHFYSDIDLHGVYDTAGNDVTRQFFDELMKNPQYRNGPLQELIQHYPQDWWQYRNNPALAGTNYGPQVGGGKTVTAYLPDSTVQLNTVQQMKALYTQNNINFSSIYPHH
ncbi:MAG TPA: hypothetical protein VIX59_20880 [Candidatus Binataceae bacterium]